jgi:uracil-DNA glycosylase
MKLTQIQKIEDTDLRIRLLARYTKERRVELVRKQVLDCTACGLNEMVRAPVPFSGPVPSPIVFVGEGPGVEEDRFGVPFVGKSGQLFDHLLTQAGLDRDSVMVLNSICCRPPENRDPLPREIAACKPNLTAQLDLSGAWVGVTLGSFALAAVTNRTRSQVKITHERGVPVAIDGRIWIPTFHPAYALRNPQAGKHILDAVRTAHRLQQGEESLPSEEYQTMVSLSDTDLIDKLGEQGYAIVRLTRVEDVVIVVADKNVEIPSHLADKLVVYTLEELVKMGEVGKASRFNGADYKHLHLVKKILGATVVS